MLKITIVEDDKFLREELVHTFQKMGYSVSSISCFVQPEHDILQTNPDLIILDVNLPKKSGYTICKWLKSHVTVPILILTAQDTLTDELTALGLGADDFLTKPCHPERLLARVQRLLETYGKIKNILSYGSLTLDTETFKASFGQNSIFLPETEGKILQLLLESPSSTVSSKAISSTIWGTSEFIDPNILQVNMVRLRKNLKKITETEIIETIRKEGYKLKDI